jgi:membrane-associated phospholipid phosphatase
VVLALVGLVLAGGAVAVDDVVRGVQQGHELSGDVRRELEVWQQLGGVGSAVFVFLLIYLTHTARARRMLDWLAAFLLTMGVVQGLKMMIGRVRPSFGEHTEWLGPGGARSVREGEAPIHAWEMGADGVARLWSMPSSHSAAGVVLAVFLAALYPKLRPLCALMVFVVMFGRVWTGAHWLSDVLAGASIALLIATPCVHGYWGVRTMDWVWRRVVNKDARAMYPYMKERGL